MNFLKSLFRSLMVVSYALMLPITATIVQSSVILVLHEVLVTDAPVIIVVMKGLIGHPSTEEEATTKVAISTDPTMSIVSSGQVNLVVLTETVVLRVMREVQAVSRLFAVARLVVEEPVGIGMEATTFVQSVVHQETVVCLRILVFSKSCV